MQEAHIDHSELTRLVERLAQSPKVLKEAKRQAFEAAAPKLKGLVDREIGGTGKVQSWQETYVGSKGGYAAVRPKAETWTARTNKKGNRYAVGHVTNAINSGHRVRRNKLGFRTSARVIEGRYFYQRAQDHAEQVAQQTAGEIIHMLTAYLEE